MKKRHNPISGEKLLLNYSVVAIFLFSFFWASCIHPCPAIAALGDFQNGNFSNGFTGWSGQLFSSGNVDPGSDTHFSLTSQGAQIGNDDSDLIATLYQDFQVIPLSSANNGIILNFWLQWSPVVQGQTPDIIATLSEFDPLSQQIGAGFDLLHNIPMSDLIQGTQVGLDVSSFASQSVRLAFTVCDFDFVTPDNLKIGDISLSEQGTNPVPIPSSLLLLISGLAGFGIFRRKGAAYLTTGRTWK